jgi:lactoylglutathione lyase
LTARPVTIYHPEPADFQRITISASDILHKEDTETSDSANSAPSKGKRVLHTCYRVGDADRSVAFYEALGFEDRGRFPVRDEAVNVFMGLPGQDDQLELTQNFGVEEYDHGTAYAHIAIHVPDIEAELERLQPLGITPEKPPFRVREGAALIAFIRDPDGYRIELTERPN